MYEETIARIAVTSAAVIRIARLLLIALVVCSIGRLTTTAPARSPGSVVHPVLAVGGRLDHMVVDVVEAGLLAAIIVRRGSPSGNSA